jgi:hypothetical protein
MTEPVLARVCLVQLNNCMNNTLNHKQTAIRRLAAQHTQQADAWLSSKGLNAQTLTAERTLVQRAVMAAKTLQREHAKLLKSCDAHTLADFQRAAATKRTRARITDGFCHRVLNIHTAVNRKLFAAHKKFIKAQNNTDTNTNTTQAPNNTKANQF